MESVLIVGRLAGDGDANINVCIIIVLHLKVMNI